MKFNYNNMQKSYRKTNYKQIENWLLKMEQLVADMRVYLDHINGGQGEQILSEKQKIITMPVHPKVVDAIMKNTTRQDCVSKAVSKSKVGKGTVAWCDNTKCLADDR